MPSVDLFILMWTNYVPTVALDYCKEIKTDLPYSVVCVERSQKTQELFDKGDECT